MYLTLDQVILVADKGKVKPDYPIIYERKLRGQRIFTLNGEPSKYAPEATPYGHLYYDAGERPCIVPHEWTWDDAQLAKDFVPPEDTQERKAVLNNET